MEGGKSDWFNPINLINPIDSILGVASSPKSVVFLNIVQKAVDPPKKIQKKILKLNFQRKRFLDNTWQFILDFLVKVFEFLLKAWPNRPQDF